MVAMVLVTLGGITGCNQKLSDEQKSILSLCALSAKERAVAFDIVVGGGIQLMPSESMSAEQLARYVTIHSRGLNAQAAMLNDLVKAVNDGSSLSARTRETLAEEARTASERYGNFVVLAAHIKTDSAATQFMNIHASALNAQAVALQKIAASFAPKEVERAQVVPAEKK